MEKRALDITEHRARDKIILQGTMELIKKNRTS